MGQTDVTKAIMSVLNIMNKWGCSAENMANILGVKQATYFKLKRNPASVRLTGEQLDRLSYILNIHAALRLIFNNPDNVTNFMAMENHNPYFNGRSPLSVIVSGGFTELIDTYHYIDALREDAGKPTH